VSDNFSDFCYIAAANVAIFIDAVEGHCGKVEKSVF
jgi:hypothetical protein